MVVVKWHYFGTKTYRYIFLCLNLIVVLIKVKVNPLSISGRSLQDKWRHRHVNSVTVHSKMVTDFRCWPILTIIRNWCSRTNFFRSIGIFIEKKYSYIVLYKMSCTWWPSNRFPKNSPRLLTCDLCQTDLLMMLFIWWKFQKQNKNYTRNYCKSWD
jgi:hypothetical protein